MEREFPLRSSESGVLTDLDRKPTYWMQYLFYTATKFGLNEVGCCLIDTETDRVGLKVSEVQLMFYSAAGNHLTLL